MAATCTLPDTVAFVEGVMNGEPYTERHIDEMVSNFGRLRGFWSPYVSIDHEAGPYAALAFGDVAAVKKGRVRLDPGGGWVRTRDDDRGPGTRAALLTTSRDVPREVGQLVHTRRLPRVSIEMFDGTFHGPDGPVPSKVLKSVSLLGARSEASKGMPPPAVQFADRVAHRAPTPPRSSGPAKCFGDLPMDPTVMPAADAAPAPLLSREELIARLAAAGYDTTLITEGVPDALLQQMADHLPPAAAPAVDTNGDGVPDAKAFSDTQRKGIQALIDAAVAKATAPLRPAIAHGQRAAETAKAAKIKAFQDKMTGGDRPRMTPVQFAALRPMLAGLDDAAVKTFGDRKTAGTALDEQIAALDAAYVTPVKTFGDRAKDPLAGSPGGITAERRAELLGHTAVGKAVLRAEAKK